MDTSAVQNFRSEFCTRFGCSCPGVVLPFDEEVKQGCDAGERSTAFPDPEVQPLWPPGAEPQRIEKEHEHLYRNKTLRTLRSRIFE